jgi:UTP:GlnB (protein PII) uridylyltransferase
MMTIPVSEQTTRRRTTPIAADLANLLVSLRHELHSALGDNLERAILYGSHARGDARPDSDVDVLVVLRRTDEVVQETVHRIAYRLMWERDFRYLLALNIMDAGHYSLLRDHQSSYLRHVEREGQPL